MKPEKDKTTRAPTCTDLQHREMEDRDTTGLRKMCGRWEGEGVKAGGFVKNKQTKNSGASSWMKKETKTSCGGVERKMDERAGKG